MFGDERRVKADQPFELGFDVDSVAGLKSVQLIEQGVATATRSFAGAQTAHVEFSLRASRATWYALVVDNVKGQKAYTNPIWVDVVRYP
jgi:hypothetical protein